MWTCTLKPRERDVRLGAVANVEIQQLHDVRTRKETLDEGSQEKMVHRQTTLPAQVKHQHCALIAKPETYFVDI